MSQIDNPNSAALDFTNGLVQSKLNTDKFMIRNLVMARANNLLLPETEKLLDNLLKMISDGTLGQVPPNPGSYAADWAIKQFNLKHVFSEVFADIEQGKMLERLISGIVGFKNPSEGTTLWGATKDLIGRGTAFGKQLAFRHLAYINNSIRRRFGRTVRGLNTARHLVALIDHGIDSNSGRMAYQMEVQEVEKQIASAALKLKNRNKLESSIGVIVAQLRGIENRFGMSKLEALTQWKDQMIDGMNDQIAYEQAVDLQYAGVLKTVKRSLLQSRHDIDESSGLVQKVLDTLLAGKSSAWISTRLNVISAMPQAGQDAATQALIDEIVTQLLVATKEPSEVEQFASDVIEIFKPINLASHLELAMDSRNEVTGGTMKWRDQNLDPFKPSYSVVPILRTVAILPGTSVTAEEADPSNFEEDPGDLVSINNLRVFGGKEVRKKDKNKDLVTPIIIDGIRSLIIAADDSLYRLNVAPTMLVLRRMFGRTTWPGNAPVANDSIIKNKFDNLNYGKQLQDRRKMANMAISSVSYMIEKIVRNDRKIHKVENRAGKIIKALSALEIGSNLIALQQVWNQTAPAILGYTAKQIFRKNHREWEYFRDAYGKMLGETLTFKRVGGDPNGNLFFTRASSLIRRHDLFIYKRAHEGVDQKKEALSSETAFTEGETNAQKIGRGVDASLDTIETLLEKGLSLSIGEAERLMARALWVAVVADMMNYKSVDEFINDNPATIPVYIKEHAKLQIVDLLAEGDQSKKADIFNFETGAPILDQALRWFIRFANHLYSTSDAVHSLSGAFFDSFGGNLYDDEVKQEALEVITQTVVQNFMFEFIRPRNMIVYGSLIAAMLSSVFGDDDDKEWLLTAQRWANRIAGDRDDMNWFAKLLWTTAIGPEKELFRTKKTSSGARWRSYAAEQASNLFMELASLVPFVTYFARTSRSREFLQRGIVDNVMEAAFSWEFGDRNRFKPKNDKTKDNPNTVDIYRYDKDWTEFLIEFAPWLKYPVDRINGIRLGIYGAQRGKRTSDVIMQFVAQGIPYREWRGQYQKDLRDRRWYMLQNN
jgi:hypothetical protein